MRRPWTRLATLGSPESVVAIVRTGRKIRVDHYTQLILINMASSIVLVVLLGGPALPAITGAFGAAMFLYLRRRRVAPKE
jgi:hypothetical protein